MLDNYIEEANDMANSKDKKYSLTINSNNRVDIRHAINGNSYFWCLWDLINNHCRNRLKHGDLNDQAFEEVESIRDLLVTELQDINEEDY